MEEKQVKACEKANIQLKEKTTYRVGNRSFVVEPVFKDDSKNTLGEILLRLMKNEFAGV